MKKVTSFENFVDQYQLQEGSTTSKMKRIITGKSAGEELDKLSNPQQQKIVSLYKQDPMEAARYLRSIIIKEKNSQFGLGLALAIAGAGLIYKAANMEPPQPPEPKPDDTPPEPQPDDTPPEPLPDETEEYVVKRGDSWWKIAKEHLPDGASNQDIMVYHKQIADANGAQHLYSGKYGSPGFEPDTWHDFSGQEVSKSVLTGEDRLFAGETIIIPKFVK